VSSVTGTIKGNRLRDLMTVGAHPLPSIGIVMFNPANMEVSRNDMENVNVGVAANQVLGTQIGHNEITGPGSDVFGSSGLLISGRDSVVFENEFKKLDTGILLFVEDPQFGSAVNTIMENNDFEQVAIDLMTGPGASLQMAAAAVQATPPSPWRKLPHR
jgi:hypothetical protein